MKIKILHVITGLEKGGAEAMLFKVVSSLDPQRFESHVLSLTDCGYWGQQLIEQGFRVKNLDLRHPSQIAKSLATFFPAYLTTRYHIIQGWMYHGNLVATLLSKASFCSPQLYWNVRQSVYDLSYEPPGTQRAIKLGARWSKFPKKVLYNSHTGMQLHQNIGYSQKNAHLLPNGFDTQKFKPSSQARQAIRQQLGLPNNALLVGLVARYDPLKDHETFLKAATQVLETFPRVHFILLGWNVDSNNTELIKHLTSEHLKKQIHLLGEQSNMEQWTAAFDIACCSSYSEGFPNILGEAMACGVPCVATDVGDNAHVIADTGLVVPCKDANAFAQALEQFISHKDKRAEFSQKARQRVETHFSLPAIVQQYETLYQEHHGTMI